MTPRARVRAGVWLAIALTLTGACAARLYSPPAGPGVPFDEATAIWRDVTARCSTTRVFVAEVRVDGWVGPSRQRFSAPLQAAFTRENDVYIEVPSLGRSFVQMGGRAERAVLLLPRDERVLRAPTRDIVEALTGLKWDAVDLLNVLSGCVTTPGAAVAGVAYGADQAAVELGGGARAWIRRVAGAWQVEAATRDGLLVEYRAREGAFPSDVRVSDASPGTTPLLVTFRVSQVSANIELPPATFELTVPAAFTPMTIEDLRSVRPLGDVKRVP